MVLQLGNSFSLGKHGDYHQLSNCLRPMAVRCLVGEWLENQDGIRTFGGSDKHHDCLPGNQCYYQSCEVESALEVDLTESGLGFTVNSVITGTI